MISTGSHPPLGALVKWILGVQERRLMCRTTGIIIHLLIMLLRRTHGHDNLRHTQSHPTKDLGILHHHQILTIADLPTTTNGYQMTARLALFRKIEEVGMEMATHMTLELLMITKL